MGAALFGAFWVGIVSGTFLWVSHVGMADHHVAEAVTSFLVLLFLCSATWAEGRPAVSTVIVAAGFIWLAKAKEVRAFIDVFRKYTPGQTGRDLQTCS